MTKRTYAEKKSAAMERAIDYQRAAANLNLSYGEIAEKQTFFEKLARRFGLVREFRENGII